MGLLIPFHSIMDPLGPYSLAKLFRVVLVAFSVLLVSRLMLLQSPFSLVLTSGLAVAEVEQLTSEVLFYLNSWL